MKRLKAIGLLEPDHTALGVWIDVLIPYSKITNSDCQI